MILKIIKQKIFITTLLQALGYSKNDIVNEFYTKEVYFYEKNLNKWKTKFDPENYKAKNFTEEIIDAKTNKVVFKLGEKVNFLNAKKLAQEGLKEIYVSNESLYGKFLHKDIQINDEILKLMSLSNTIINERLVVT